MRNDTNISNRLKGKNLLIISHDYSSFIKNQIEIISPNFKHVYVLVRYNPIAEISRLLPIEEAKRFRKKNLLVLRNKPENISVILTPLFYLPTDSGYKKLGEKHFRAVDKAIKKSRIKFDLIHSHFTWTAGYVGAKLKEKYNLPFIVTARGYDIYDLPFRDEEWTEKIRCVLNAADYITTVSNSNLECIKKLNVESPTKVILNGYRADLFYPRDLKESKSLLHVPFDKKVILNIGNLVEIKGHKYLIEAMKEVVRQRRNILCFIIGSGKLKNKLNNQIKKSGLGDCVKLIGNKPHSEIPSYINACDVFVLPSLNEGNPNVMFETLGCGRPFVGTKVGGEPEIITSEDFGFLVEPSNSKSLANKILIALEKKWDYKKIARYAQQFRIENKAKEVLEIYKKVSIL